MSADVRRWLLGIFASAGIGCLGGATVQTNSTLPLRRVVIYRNGVGYFERQGRVANDNVEFRVRRSEVGDFLATLSVRDRGSRSVASAAFPMSGEGESGRVDESERRTVRVQLDGRNRDLSVGYMTSAPIWRPSYRLLFDRDGVELQAWGIVQNLSGEDWRSVRLALVAGAPVAFRSELAEAVTSPRPLVRDRGDVIESVPGAVSTMAQSGTGDTDADGIVDVDDRCPDSPEDIDGDSDTDGCPDVDNDSDRVPDATDRCPNEPETYNGFEDDDGCPDAGGVIVESSMIRILQHVAFAPDRERFAPSAVPLLDAIVATLRGNPQITRIAIEGHADRSEGHGAETARRRLAERRASNVLAYLVAHGIAAARLEVRAFGSTRPLDDGASGAARARNRRVSFNIASLAPTAAAANSRPVSVTPGGGSSTPTRATTERPANPATLLASQGGTSRVEIRLPVSIPDRSAAMVPLASQRVPGQRMFLFAPESGVAASVSHPFEVARFENRTGALLERGPVSIFDEGAFLGQGMLDPLPEGGTVTVPFAIERGIDVEHTTAHSVEGVRLVRIARSDIIVERFNVVRTVYRLRNGIARPVSVMIRHALPRGAELHGVPDATEISAGIALVPARIAARFHSEITIETRVPFSTHVGWPSEDAAHAIVEYLRGTSASEPNAGVVRAALEIQRQILDGGRERNSLDERRRDLVRAASETRENLATIERTPGAADLRTQLLTRLSQTSAQVADADRRIVEIDSNLGALRLRLSEAVRTLDVSVDTPASAHASLTR